MKLAVFVYDFPHWKSCTGLLNLVLNGYTPDIVFAQGRLNLGIRESNIRTGLRHELINSPFEIASKFNIPYHTGLHDSPETIDTIQKNQYDLGIVLGARILKKKTIDSFSIGVLNMHPGLLPINRGLDNLKYAIAQGIPQGVTTHLIDERIDAGRMIDRKIVPVYSDDSFVDIDTRLQETGQVMMLSALKRIEAGDYPKRSPGDDDIIRAIYNEEYHSSMPPREEILIEGKFGYYRHFYQKIVERYNEEHT